MLLAECCHFAITYTKCIIKEAFVSMEYIWILVAFACGFLAKEMSLPPLIGYLFAGFGLHLMGVEPNSSFQTLADFGVMLLLFTIGLKLNVSNLLKPEIWAGSTGHMAAMILLTVLTCIGFAALGLNYFSKLDWSTAALLAFAMSFSSTVCAVKILEDRGEMKARHGQVAIGILIIQDIAAVIFLSLTADKPPSWWALALLALPLARPLMGLLLQRSGHGEMLPLAGLFFAFTGGELFEAVGLKANLGALVFGILLSTHVKASELAKSLLSFKDLFLIGFFLSIGFTALPTIEMLGTALVFAIALPVKMALLFLWLTRLKLRGRTAFLTAISLANYSEFGLIVCSVSVAQGWLEPEWLVIMALAVAASFIFSALINANAHVVYARWKSFITYFESPIRLPEDDFSQPTAAQVLIIGMGRVGTGTYDNLTGRLHKHHVWGVDAEKVRVDKHRQAQRQVILGDAEDATFWDNISLAEIKLIMLAMPSHQDMLEVVKQLKLTGFQGKVAGIARYADEREQLLNNGVDVVFNLYAEAGAGFAEESLKLLN